MCDYSLEGYRSREAKVGDRLTITPYAHGFMEQKTARQLVKRYHLRVDMYGHMCLTCLKPGTRLDLTLDDQLFSNVEFIQIEKHGYRDHLFLNDGHSPVPIAFLPRGTTATVLSIPGTRSLDEKLGISEIVLPDGTRGVAINTGYKGPIQVVRDLEKV